MTPNNPPTPPPSEQYDPLVPLVHNLPERIAMGVVYDIHHPDYLVRVQQLDAAPAGQYSVRALLDVLAEAMVGLIHANAAYDYMSVNASLTHVIHALEKGTFDTMTSIELPGYPSRVNPGIADPAADPAADPGQAGAAPAAG